MDKEIVATIQEENELEAEIVKSAAIQEAISIIILRCNGNNNYANPECFCHGICTKRGTNHT